MRRGNWLFFPFWIGAMVYIWLMGEGVIPKSWNRFFFPIFTLLFLVNFVYGFIALNSARKDAKRSQNPDKDVAAIIDGEIDIAEYGRRKAYLTHED